MTLDLVEPQVKYGTISPQIPRFHLPLARRGRIFQRIWRCTQVYGHENTGKMRFETMGFGVSPAQGPGARGVHWPSSGCQKTHYENRNSSLTARKS